MNSPSPDIHADRILILDFGAQYTQLIARRIRAIGVYCEVWSWDHNPEEIATFAPKGIILSGGPESTVESGSPRAPQQVFDARAPLLGICYGMQTMATQLGGKVEGGHVRELGHARVRFDSACPLFGFKLSNSNAEPAFDAWMSHGDRVTRLPPGFSSVAATNDLSIAAMADQSRHYYAVQFHPEVTHTQYGDALIRCFVTDICGCRTLWTPTNIVEAAIASVKTQIGEDRVLLGLSGGVDSSVVAALLKRAIGDKLVCVFVDTGLLRWHEGDQIMAMLAQHMGVRIIRINAEQRYLAALRGVENPEEKRKIIGQLFIEIFDEEAHKLQGVHWLAQGTIYSDVIESAGSKNSKAHVIKSHHNVAGLPEKMNFKLVEPLRELFKDEVRRIGIELGLPPIMVERHPFPGPGLGVRILGEVTETAVNLLARADAIFIDELQKWNLYHTVSQAFAVYLPVKSVGVVGDMRAYEPVIALRAVETIDFMTAHWAHLPYEFLDHVSRRIVNELRGVSRVVYDISSKPPATIEWE